MKKKMIFPLLILLMLTFLTSGCSQKETTTINVFNWGQYMDPQIIKDFTKETGIKVNYEEYDTNEIMYPKIKVGSSHYDVIFPSDYMIEKMIEEDLLLPLDFANIPNYKNIGADYKNLAYDPNNAYSVPYLWGTIGILYNKTMVTEPVDSWSILWDEKYKGEILMQNSVRDSFAVALKKLGYSLNTTNTEELDAAKALLIQQNPLVQAYVNDEITDKMIGNEAALGIIWSGEALLAIADNPDLAYVLPKEGTNFWVDAVCIPKTAQNKLAAEQFINYLCDPEVALKNSLEIGYSTPNVETQKLLEADLLNNLVAYPTQEMLKGSEVFIDLGDELTKLYNAYWQEVLVE